MSGPILVLWLDGGGVAPIIIDMARHHDVDVRIASTGDEANKIISGSGAQHFVVIDASGDEERMRDHLMWIAFFKANFPHVPVTVTSGAPHMGRKYLEHNVDFVGYGSTWYQDMYELIEAAKRNL